MSLNFIQIASRDVIFRNHILQQTLDWFCFYYLIRNSLVALLEALMCFTICLLVKCFLKSSYQLVQFSRQCHFLRRKVLIFLLVFQ